MERIQGESIPKAWRKLSMESRAKVFAQLKVMLEELRALELGKEMVGVESCSGGSVRDSRLPRCFPRMGPFGSIQDFHLWLRNDLLAAEIPEEKRTEHQDLLDMISKQDELWPPPIFTHGDLNPSNIFVRDDDIVGIIDWEFSGWYPHYWEYTSAWLGSLTTTAWQADLERFLQPFPEELEMEKTRYKWWGE